jgi:CYTH domain-containing protein
MTDNFAARAAALGFPKLKYVFVERERRWLCSHIPMDRVVKVEVITDLYVIGTQLRLRRADPVDGGPPAMRLARKVDMDAETRLITSLYLGPEEFALLANLPGRVLKKTRYALQPVDGAILFIDRFEGPLEGLLMGEAEFETAEALAAFPLPDYATAEVTHDLLYTGGQLAVNGLPHEG